MNTCGLSAERGDSALSPVPESDGGCRSDKDERLANITASVTVVEQAGRFRYVKALAYNFLLNNSTLNVK